MTIVSPGIVEDFSTDVDGRLDIAWLLDKLDPMEREILWLHEVEELKYEDIGQVVGIKYRGKPYTGSAIRYRQEKILAKLAPYREIVLGDA